MNLVILLGIVNYLMAIVTYNKVLSQTLVADLWDGLNAGTDSPLQNLTFKKMYHTLTPLIWKVHVSALSLFET